MRYKVTNIMPPTEDGKETRLETIFDSFEKVVDKIVRDLNSIWKGIVPPDQTFTIKEVPNDTPLGMRFFVGDEERAVNVDEVKEAYELMGVETMKYYQKLRGFDDMKDRIGDKE